MTKQEKTEYVETSYEVFKAEGEPFQLENGETIKEVTIAYETYGNLNAEKSNAILICHALSGDAHAAGLRKGEEKPGWWDNMVGPGKAFDTDRYFIICSNVLGGCRGSTGPSSINRETGRPYGLKFPAITIGDMVCWQKKLIDRLGIKKLLCVAGGSMGGMQVLEWLASYPDAVWSAVPIATALKHSPQQIAFSEVGRQAIMADPNWNSGDYYDDSSPSRGLALARMIGHITYMSDNAMAEKFGRFKKQDKKRYSFKADFQVEGYLHYRGDSFVKRFDANSYLYITKAMDNFDAEEDNALLGSLTGKEIKVLVISFKSDWLYPTYQSKEIVKICKIAGIQATFCEIYSRAGHDSFLLDIPEQKHLIQHFLARIYRDTHEKTDAKIS